MSISASQTQTFTAVDIRKVVDNFAADFSMKAQSTGLRTRDSVAAVVSDLKVFAEYKYLIAVKLLLKDSSGEIIRGTLYEVSTDAIGWAAERPGNNLWPRTPGGTLKVTAILSQEWWNKSDAQREAFINGHEMNNSWRYSEESNSLLHLIPTLGQRYASNGYGWQRTNYG